MGIPANNKYSKGATTKPKPGAKAPVKGSRFGAFAPREEGPPMLECLVSGQPALYRVRYESAEECMAQKPGGQNTIKSYAVVESGDGPTPVGSRVLVLHIQSQYGRADFNAQIVATAGYDEDDEDDLAAYLAFDPDGHFFAASVGDLNEFSELAAGLADRVVDVQVSRGKDDGKGGYYRRYKWGPVADDDPDQVNPKIEAAAE